MRITLNPNPWLFEDLKLDLDPKLRPIKPKTKHAKGKVNISWMRTFIRLISSAASDVYKRQIQEKFTLPFACLVFGLIVSSLGSKSNLTSSKSQGFGLSVILILIYYVMSFIFSSFGVKGTLPPIFAAWLPVLISMGGGIYLLRKSSSF